MNALNVIDNPPRSKADPMNLTDFLQSHGGRPDENETDVRIADFGDPAAEYAAAHDSAALFVRDDLGLLELTGGDRAKFLHNFCTNDIKRLQPGEGCEAFACNVKGRILAHIFVAVRDDRLWIVTDRNRVEFLARHLDRYLITEDVSIADRSNQFVCLMVCGPAASAALKEAFDVPLPEREGDNVVVETGGDELLIARWDAWNIPAAMLLVPTDAATSFWPKLRHGRVRAAGTAVEEALRIEACFPKYGVDVSDEHLAQETNRTARAISFTKGCYLGQEPIARIDAIGHVNRQLCGVRFPSATGVTAGAELVDPSDGTPAGRLSSAALVPATGVTAALAMLNSKLAAEGSAVRLSADPQIEGTVFVPT